VWLDSVPREKIEACWPKPPDRTTARPGTACRISGKLRNCRRSISSAVITVVELATRAGSVGTRVAVTTTPGPLADPSVWAKPGAAEKSAGPASSVRKRVWNVFIGRLRWGDRRRAGARAEAGGESPLVPDGCRGPDGATTETLLTAAACRQVAERATARHGFTVPPRIPARRLGGAVPRRQVSWLACPRRSPLAFPEP
jgi:hypothetical protein